ncbi:MAG: hypothetical protein IPG45_28970 [Deltaproteobacteria bacterium]|jgi:hypothetical protein|nr:hypothetical protein [Deltaproteobacteria bacterium]
MAVLRVSGRDFEVDAYLAQSRLVPYRVFYADEPRPGPRRDPSAPARSGFVVTVSRAELHDLPGQVGDACTFLEEYGDVLAALGTWPGVEDLRLDFGVALRSGPGDSGTQFDYFPPRLVRLAGALGLGLELSIYPGPG